MCIHDCEYKTRIQEEKGIKIGQIDKPRSNYFFRSLLGKHAPRPVTEIEKSRVIQEHCIPKPQRKTTRNLPR